MVTPTLYDQGSIPLIFNDVNVFVKQKKKMNKDVLRFFPEWHDKFKLSHAFQNSKQRVCYWDQF